MAQYLALKELAIADSNTTADERHQQLEETMQRMIKEKKPLVIAHIEKLIESHLKISSITRVPIIYRVLAEAISYTFPDDIWRQMIEDHYEPLGYEINWVDLDPVGLFLIIRPEKSARYCNCSLV